MLFRCPHCQAESEIDHRYEGRQGPCRHCGTMLTVPTELANGRRRLAAVLQAALAGGLYVGGSTFLLLTLPGYGSVTLLLQDLIQPQSLSADDQRQLIGHGVLWFTLTGVGTVLSGILAALLGLRAGGAARLDDGCRGAGWGCALASVAAISVFLLLGWLGSWFLTPLQLAGRLGAIFLCGLLGAAIGIWRAG